MTSSRESFVEMRHQNKRNNHQNENFMLNISFNEGLPIQQIWTRRRRKDFHTFHIYYTYSSWIDSNGTKTRCDRLFNGWQTFLCAWPSATLRRLRLSLLVACDFNSASNNLGSANNRPGLLMLLLSATSIQGNPLSDTVQANDLERNCNKMGANRSGRVVFISLDFKWSKCNESGFDFCHQNEANTWVLLLGSPDIYSQFYWMTPFESVIDRSFHIWMTTLIWHHELCLPYSDIMNK